MKLEGEASGRVPRAGSLRHFPTRNPSRDSGQQLALQITTTHSSSMAVPRHPACPRTDKAPYSSLRGREEEKAS